VSLRGIADFAGRWRFRRRIEGLSAAPGRIFDGIAVFSPLPDGFLYEESGEAWPDRRATRLKWRAVGQGTGHGTGQGMGQGIGQGVDLCFADGSDFHHLDLSNPVASAWYEGDGARHELSYNFTRWPDWRAIWRLRDGTSDTTMITEYQR